MAPRRITPEEDQIVLNRPDKMLIPLSILGGAVIFCCTGVILYMNIVARLERIETHMHQSWTVDQMRRYTWELQASDIKRPDVDAIAHRP